ncbi:olfactory receptor 1019-like [Spea bombifrons]|uniref:olfactory receptor 1019-like n=1 Tax=Spea bombifrons TaxID=233779 RepID=UPI00234A4F5A|nr:olfactory receptor 1019-like [Spea bombifrons]
MENHTSVTEFIIVGLTEVAEYEMFLFLIFLCIYITTVFLNASIVFLYIFSPNLRTPMYFFLANFSFLEICYVSSTTPKMLSVFLVEPKTISFYGCALQMYWFLLLGTAESYMLAAMAYDRYNAICHPLLYSAIMNTKVCVQLVAGSWLIGVLNSLANTTLTFRLQFCRSRINHFLCDIPPLLKLACAETWVNEIALVIGGSIVFGSFILTMISYTQIICAILKIQSNSGRKKSFSTCTSHFMVVTIFYGSGSMMYFQPKSSYSMSKDRTVAVMYTIIAPLLNPFIYSVRNQDVKIAVKKLANCNI